ncbi:hypothetical protein ABIB08_008875 [Bradyrhizobium sp. RT11b]
MMGLRQAGVGAMTRRFLRWVTPLPSREKMVIFAGRWFE